MNNYPGYRIDEKVDEDAKWSLHRGQRLIDDYPVLIKSLRAEHPSNREIAQLRHEFDVSREVEISGVAKPLALEPWGNSLALIQEDFGGTPLRKIFHDRTP